MSMLKHYLILFLITLISIPSFSQGKETFSKLADSATNYDTRNWTGDNGLPWKATDARTDQLINGRAIAIRSGSVTCENIPNGIASLTFTHQQVFSGSDPVLEVYINGIKVGSANPTTAVTTSTINNLNVSGNFNLEIRQVTPKLRIAIDDIIWTSFNATPCIAPSAPPTSLTFRSTPTAISGSFISANPAADSYLVIRSKSGTLSEMPANGTTYATGSQLGGGYIVDNIPGNTFTDRGLSPDTKYFYFIFSNNYKNCSGGPLYLKSLVLQDSSSTMSLPACIAPVNPPISLVLMPSNNSISGSFTAANDANRYLVIISGQSTLSEVPQNGNTYSNGQAFGGGTVVSYGNTLSFTANNLSVATPYYIFIFAANGECTGEPFYNKTPLAGSTSTSNNTTGIPAGYYNGTGDLSCQPLKTKLRDIITNGYTELTYTPGVWNAYQFTDIHRNDANTADVIWDMYSDVPNGPDPYYFSYQVDQCGGGGYKKEGDCYNREHSTPQSWFNKRAPMVTDINHLFPTDGYVNNVRNNYPYGEVSSATETSKNGSKLGTGNNFGYQGIVFEPINDYKGDVARASFYMATRYQNEIIDSNWALNGTANAVFLSDKDETDTAKRRLQIYDTWYLKTIFKWNNSDPVSKKEIDRNNAVYYKSGQNNRNPFIDHPEYVAKIWECTGALPVTILDFTAELKNESVIVKWYATYETSFKEFEIERSTDGVSFYKIAAIQGRNLATYSFTDENLPSASVVYYRLKMIDIDGKYNYSKVASIRLNNNFSNAVVAPNPVTSGELKIKLKNELTGNSNLQIFDFTGRIIKSDVINKKSTIITQNISKLPAGRYFVKITNDTEVINTSFVIIK